MKAYSFSMILGTCGLVCAMTALNASAAPPPGYRLVWSDEFEGTSLDTNKWSHRGLGKRRDALNVADSVSVEGGHLTIMIPLLRGRQADLDRPRAGVETEPVLNLELRSEG